MQNVDYNEWAEYIVDLSTHSGRAVNSVLELGCGTGNVLFALENEQEWNKIVGLDRCYEMLIEANKKKQKFDSSAYFINADMKNFAFDYKFDLVLCLFDSINYLTDEKFLRKMLLNSYFSLKDNKLLIFDMITVKKMDDFFKEGLYAQDMEDISLIWESETIKFGKEYNIKASFFKKTEDDKFEKIVENHRKRIYGIDEMANILDEMDFNVLGSYDAYSFREADNNSERVFFLCSKGGI